ncbi:MAG: hypothetical protein ACW967_05915 [Candidatus Hodarchaeales archaeon]|jgi:hypothetical protein
MNKKLRKYAFRFWMLDTILAMFNYFIFALMIYEPILGTLPAHRIAMATRIVIIFILSFILLRKVETYETKDLIQLGVYWVSLELILEWGGSLFIGRTVNDILIGWNILEGYIWILVLFAYLLGPYIVGKHLIDVYIEKKSTKNKIFYTN